MTPGQFVEEALDTPLCAELKSHIDKLYSMYKKDSKGFQSQIQSVGRGQKASLLQLFLPYIFHLYEEETE